jgi:hypothetical protein
MGYANLENPTMKHQQYPTSPIKVLTSVTPVGARQSMMALIFDGSTETPSPDMT